MSCSIYYIHKHELTKILFNIFVEAKLHYEIYYQIIIITNTYLIYLPTVVEWSAERLSWSSNNAAGAFGSPLKLVVGGFRNRSNGSLYSVGSSGDYWSSSVSGLGAGYLLFHSSNAVSSSNYRAGGYSVRCIKD